jgi:hypothetical protein
MAQMLATPANMGASSFSPLDVWGRVFAFDWGRTSPMPGMMNSLKLASDLRLRKRTVAYALALAVPVVLAVSFYSFFYTVYSHGGAKSLEGYANGWTFVSPPRETFNSIKGKAFKLDGLLDKFDDKFETLWVESKGGANTEALAQECTQIKANLKKIRQEAWDVVGLEAFVLREDKIARDNPEGWHTDPRRLPGALTAAGIYSEAQARELIRVVSEAENIVAPKPAPNDEVLRREAVKQNPNNFQQIQDLQQECRLRALSDAQAVALKQNTYRLRDFLLENNRITADEAEKLSIKAQLDTTDLEKGIARVDSERIFWTAFGAVLMVVFMIVRTRVFWFPHPIGYVTWMHPTPMEVLWFSLLLGWFLKWAIVKYGGFRVYGQMKRFFVGLVVGEVLAAAFWITIFGVTDTVAQTREFYRINIDP